MSNLGTKEIKIPSNLNLVLKQNSLELEGEFGKMLYKIDRRFNFELTENKSLKIYPFRDDKKKLSKEINCLWGTQYSLLKNYIMGLSRGFTKKLELVGVGFRATILDNKLILKLGYSHEVSYQIPSDIIIQCPKQDKIVIFGLDKQKVNEVTSTIKLLKKVDPYKGKGILLENTNIKLKEGKKK